MTHDNIFLTVVNIGEGSALTISRAVHLAEKFGAGIELFTCCYDEHIAGTRFFDSAQQSAARKNMVSDTLAKLEEIASPLRKQGLTVKTHACWDRPEHEAVSRRAIDIRARAILRDCHYHNLISRAIFTNEDWQLVRTAPCPLLLVKKQRKFHDTAKIWAAVDPMHSHEKPESLDQEILAFATDFTSGLKGSLDVVHSYDPASALAAAAAPAVIPAPLPLDRITQDMRDAHESHLHALTDLFDLDRGRVHNLSGSARTILPGLAIENDIDILIMGAVARTGLDKLVIGSTAEKVLDHLPCDVLIVKTAELYAKLGASMAKGSKARFVA